MKQLSELSDQELLIEAKKLKSSMITHALFIGLLIGISIYSILENPWGFLPVVILFFVYKLMMKPNNMRELKKLLKERNLG